MTKLLMSAENPAGFKLEDLLRDVIADLRTKNRKIAGDHTKAAIDLRERNHGIINHLVESLVIQETTMAELDKLGPDQGPTGTPRIEPKSGEGVSPFTFYTGSAGNSGNGAYRSGAALHYLGVPIPDVLCASVDNVVEPDEITISVIRVEIANPTPVICGPAPKD